MSKIHIIPHTHWDREWYKPFQFFRVKLVYVIDKILDILEKDEDFKHFLLDGQTIVLEDYLQIKPENYERLKNLITAGRIIVGPWYVQPDEFAPDGESLIRNLQIGISIAEKFGKSMMVGYVPDSFGQSGQLPHILKGFHIESAVMMRGVASEKIKQSEFAWEGVNGDEVLGIYLPQGYSNAMHLPTDFSKAKLRLFYTFRKIKKWSATENILIMNGVDHQFPQEHLSGHIEKLNARNKRSTYLISTLEYYISNVRAARPTLPKLKGDLLAPTRNRVHSSIASTRIYQKQKNRKMEVLLEKYVEPIATIGWVLNAEYPSELINQAWKYLIQNQTHDGIGGCCTDEVHREMDQRFVDIKNIGETLQNAYARAISHRISRKQLILTVFNNALTQGKQVVRASVYTKEKNFILKTADGKTIPFQIENIEEVDLSKLSIWTLYLKTKEEAYKVDILFEADFDFNVGYKVYDIIEGKSYQEPESGITITDDNRLENKFIRADINRDGSITLLDKNTGVTYRDLLIFEDCGDAGDTYNYSPVKNDTVVTSQNSEAAVEFAAKGPLKTTVTIKHELKVPAHLVNQDQERSAELVILPITTHMTMYANLKRIDFVTEVNNTALDHRLRVLFPAGLSAEYSHAETQFGTVKRPIRLDTRDWKKQKWSEKPLPIYSQQKFVDLNDGKQGLAVLNRGLPEYEIYEHKDSTIAITLLRGVGMLGKEDLLIRPGRPSGMSMPTPDAQCPGQHTLEYSICPHAGDVDMENVPKMAAEFDAEPLAVQSHLKLKKILRKFKIILGLISLENLTSHIGSQLGKLEKTDLKLAAIDNENLLISAVKRAERENALIIRFYNASAAPVENSSISLGLNADSAHLTDFYEQETKVLVKSDPGTYALPVIKPYSAVTAKFRINRNQPCIY